MRFKLPILMMLLTVLAIVPVRAQTLLSSDDEVLAQRALVIKPSLRELSWRAIPWMVDLNEAWRIAQAERRPLFLWASGDDPLERC